ncbi:MAG: hypothetical protein ABL890_04790 [Candidatus Peribacteraceae bacterium]
MQNLPSSRHVQRVLNDPNAALELKQRYLDRLRKSDALGSLTQSSLVVSSIRALLAKGKIEDPEDKKMIKEATRFLRAPTEVLSDLDRHAYNIREVLTVYRQQGKDVPLEIGSLYSQLVSLVSQQIRLLCKSDKMWIEEAIAFLDAPTELVSDIERHASNIGEVLAGYMQQGEDFPPEIDALHCQLSSLLYRHYVTSFKTESGKHPCRTEKVKLAYSYALDIAKALSRGYQDDSFLKEVESLHTK